ncbi:Nicotinamidase [Actinomycetales bacterium JB111]|nr:Nicotinamidase [Actinomycetales bacterium JB111]
MISPGLDPSRTAVLVIDMQNDFVTVGAPLEVPAARAAVPHIAAILEAARAAGALVVYSAHQRAPLGPAQIPTPNLRTPALAADSTGLKIYPPIAPDDGDLIIVKHQFSAFFDTTLGDELTARGVDTVLITGATTENCCFSTARDAAFRGLRVLFIEDATGTFDYPDCGFGSIAAADVHRTLLAVLAYATCEIATTADAVAALASDRDPENNVSIADLSPSPRTDAHAHAPTQGDPS